MRSSQDAADSLPGPAHRGWAIFAISVLGLFLELMLIRWIGTEVRIFAYLQNTVLIVCFLGLGMGCFTCRQPTSLRAILLPLAFLSLLLAMPMTRLWLSSITELLSVMGDLVIWQQAISQSMAAAVMNVAGGLLLTLGMMILLWEIFVPIGRILGRLMDDHPHTIQAYSINIAGSLIGIWMFAALSALSAPPWIWLGCSAALLLLFVGGASLPKAQRAFDFALIAMILIAGLLIDRDSDVMETVWSPYQKLALIDVDDDRFHWNGKCIMVNNAGYQGMIDLRPESDLLQQVPERLHGLSQYDLPTRFQTRPKNVLIVGAGSGNDVAGALRGGAQRVTGVEIDPVIIDMGRRHHPEKPYDSSRVRVVNDDARSFFATTDEKFDLIVFGLLDSHTTTAMTNARLDHYVYTQQSIERAKSLLTEDGVMVLSFEAVKPYIADRMASCIRQTFGREPLVFRVPPGVNGWGGVLFVAGNKNVIDAALANDPPLAAQIAAWQVEDPVAIQYNTTVTTDDWPYIYLEHARIPTLYFLLAGLMIALLAYGKLRLKIKGVFGGWQKGHWHFFFMGAAFLLLEVQNISKASVVLGNTWIVNGVIISGILVMILMANWIASRFPQLPQKMVCGLLIASCLALYFVDLSTFAFLPVVVKAVLVGALTTLPMLFAGIVFIDSFTKVEHKDRALGANLIGSLVGGMLQSLTFVIGIKALLFVVAGLYVAALWTRPQAAIKETPTPIDDKPLPPQPQPRQEELVSC